MREPFVDFMKTELMSNTVLIACGLPASYKTETTEVVAALKGYKILRTDMIRLEVLRDEDIFDEKVASNMDKRTLVYDEMFRIAHELAAEVAGKNRMTLVIQQTQCPQAVSLRRISERTKENYESNALTEQAYFNNVKKFEAVDLEDLKRLYPHLEVVHLLVDTTSDLTEEWFVIGKNTR